jgi:ribonuclease PH
MLYRFKSRATADVIMLEPHGRKLLEIMGKSADATGIVTASQIPAALAALAAAVAREEENQPTAGAGQAQSPAEDGNAASTGDSVSLRQRARPLQEMLERSAQDGKDVVWGV